jgi:hypothetical protein
MSEATLSRGELDFLNETFALTLEEFEGIEEAAHAGDLEEYVLTTGALENVKEAAFLIGKLYERLHAEEFEDLEEELDEE